MNNLVIAVFPIKSGKTQAMTNLLLEILPDTRSYKGCLSLELYLNDTTNIYTLIEDWDSLEDYSQYVEWRKSTGLFELFDALIIGGAAGIQMHQHGKSIANY
jgi:quinol monooxygenase YgiN